MHFIMKYEWKTSAKSRLAVCHDVKKEKKAFRACRWGECKNTNSYCGMLRSFQRKTRRDKLLKQSESFDAFHRLNYAWDALQSEINSETLCNTAKHHLSCRSAAEIDDKTDETLVPELLLRTIKENYRSFVLSFFSVIQLDYAAAGTGPD